MIWTSLSCRSRSWSLSWSCKGSMQGTGLPWARRSAGNALQVPGRSQQVPQAQRWLALWPIDSGANLPARHNSSSHTTVSKHQGHHPTATWQAQQGPPRSQMPPGPVHAAGPQGGKKLLTAGVDPPLQGAAFQTPRSAARNAPVAGVPVTAAGVAAAGTMGSIGFQGWHGSPLPQARQHLLLLHEPSVQRGGKPVLSEVLQQHLLASTASDAVLQQLAGRTRVRFLPSPSSSRSCPHKPTPLPL